MKRLPLFIGLGLLALVVFWAIGFYNGSVGLGESVTQQWSNVENAYQLRADKTKNLVEIVKGAAYFEKEATDYADDTDQIRVIRVIRACR